MNTSMPINLQRSWPSRQKSGVGGTRCGGGSNSQISTAGAKTAKPPMSAPRSRRWSARSESFARPMKSSERPQRILHRRSSPAHSNDDRLHPLPGSRYVVSMRGEDHRDDLGVEPICKVLPIAQSTFYAHAAILKNPDLASDRAKRDADLNPEIKRFWEENNEVYGIRKVWHQMQRRSSLSCAALWLD